MSHNAFDSSHRKIARAKEHFKDVNARLIEFANLCPYEQVVEEDANRSGFVTHKIRITKELPDGLIDATADMVQNLRNALDNAAYAVAVTSGKINPKFTAFPFAGSVEQMANSLGRCKDLPKEIQSLFCGFQPYLGGNDPLWALNEICNTDKHKMLLPMGIGVVRSSASVNTLGYFSMPDPHVWNRAKNEMEIITLGPGTKFEYDFDFRLYVAFNDIKVVDGQYIMAVLNNLLCVVERLLMAIEAESRRLGIVK